MFRFGRTPLVPCDCVNPRPRDSPRFDSRLFAAERPDLTLARASTLTQVPSIRILNMNDAPINTNL
jgi:hypothetical protein